jgi:hypothetical protein
MASEKVDENVPMELTMSSAAAAAAAEAAAGAGGLTPRTLEKARALDRRIRDKQRKEAAAAAAPAALDEEPLQPQPPLILKKRIPSAKSSVKDAPIAVSAAAEAVSPASLSTQIMQLTKQIDDGSAKLSAEDLKNPFSTDFNKLLLKKEILERSQLQLEDAKMARGARGLGAAEDYTQHLYPTLNDPNFNTKIALRKEFYDTKMDVDNTEDVEAKAEMLCNAPFELAPNQQFVRNFLSVETPYNSLLLYHGLGTGKTCSAISVAEEMRDYMKQMGITQQIIVIASPNVQENFRLQLFDERELKEIEPGVWNIRACTGNKFIKEINPMNMKGLTRDKVIKQIKRLIQSYYLFFGYNEFANYVRANASSVGISADDAAIQEIRKNRKKQGASAAASETGAKRGRKSSAFLAKQVEIESAALENLSVTKLRKLFANTLIIIDEVHNIRITDDNRDKRLAKILYQIVLKVNNVRLLLLSGTPMYNSYKEIIWLINLMNLNDKRATIEISDVFDDKGNFRVDEQGREIGADLLIRKATGYLSFVRGENPYTFPYRVFPREHSPEFSLLNQTQGANPAKIYPRIQMNGHHIDQPIEHIDVYMTVIGDIQEAGYKYIVSDMKASYIFKKTAAIRRKAVAEAAAVTASEETGKTKKKPRATTASAALIDESVVVDAANFPSFENMDTIGYAAVQRPLEALNIVYPHSSLIDFMNNPAEEADVDIAACIGKEGLRNVMNYAEGGNPSMRQHFEYKPEFIRNFKVPASAGSAGAGAGSGPKSTAHRIFAPNNIGRYSAKIKNICDKILSSDGIVLAYSQYIDGGVVPIALALEELGFTRYSANSTFSTMFKTKPAPSIDALTFLQQKQHTAQFPDQPFRPARYSVITGDPTISPDNLFELKALTDEDNTNGEKVKVVIISVAGAEGLDFKNIRQVHILEPWYNMNLLEQIIGRAIRNCSHKRLPYSQRNVELYLYGTYLTNENIEAIDLYLYRLSEFKAIKIGVVSRALRTSAVDCLLNIQHNTQTAEQLNRRVPQKLSSRKEIEYQIGARPYSALCDYMQRCDYVCKPTFSNGKPIQEQQELYGFSSSDSGDESSDESGAAAASGAANRGDVRLDTFNEKFMSMNIDKIKQKIGDLFKESFFYKKVGKNGIIAHINATRPYPIAQINLALTHIVTDANEYVHDKYGRIGHVVNVGDYYMFQPVELSDAQTSIYDRSAPIPYKHESVTYPLTREITEDYLKLQNVPKPMLKAAIRSEIMESSNADVARNVEKMVAELSGKTAPAAVPVSVPVQAAEAAPLVTAAAAAAAAKEPQQPSDDIQELLTTLQDTIETCKTVYEKHTKDQDEWYYYCGKVIKQISQTPEFGITEEELHKLIIANLLEHLFIKDSKMLINYLYHKNNNSMTVQRGSAAGAVATKVQPLTQFEQMFLEYYSQQALHRPLVGKRAAAAGAAAAGSATKPEDLALLLFNENNPKYELLVLRYDTPNWVKGEPEDERDFGMLLSARQTEQIRGMNLIIGFVTYFKKEYLIFKVKMMQKKRDKGARCDQAGKSDTVAMINNILSLNPVTDNDEYKLTTDNTKDRTQKELCVFQEFLLRTFNANKVNGKKWFFTPGDAILCDIEKLHL